MKSWKIVLCLLPILALVSSCGHGINVMDRPKGYSLDFWVSDRMAAGALKEEREFDKSELGVYYLDSHYSFANSSNAKPALPKEYTYYWLAIQKTDYVVARVRITDPKIDVYGLTMKSSEWKIKKTLERRGFKYMDMYSGLDPCFSKGDVNIRICEAYISVDLLGLGQTSSQT